MFRCVFYFKKNKIDTIVKLYYIEVNVIISIIKT